VAVKWVELAMTADPIYQTAMMFAEGAVTSS
jgi:hypothetical protein